MSVNWVPLDVKPLILDRVGILSSHKGRIEVEARVYDDYEVSRRRENAVPKVKWERLRDRLIASSYSVEYSTLVRTHYSNTNIRKTVVGDEVLFEEKIKQGKLPITDPENWLRYTVSLENSINPPDNIETYAKTVRNIERLSFECGDGLRIDLSKVTVNSVVMYEIEIELLAYTADVINSEALSTLVRVTKKILTWYNGTRIYYNRTVLGMINVYINAYLGDAEKSKSFQHTVNRRVLNNVSVLRLDQLKYGNIIGPDVQYGITWKSDGEKGMFVACWLGVWFILPPYVYNLLAFDNMWTIFPKGAKTFDMNILQVELIPPEHRHFPEGDPANTVPYLMEVLDSLVVDGVVVAKNDIRLRLQAAFDHFNEVQLPDNLGISLHFKEIQSFSNKIEFFRASSRMLGRLKEHPVSTDGLIFVPVNKGYTSSYPVMKWKSAKETTIDFYIHSDDDGKPHLLYVDGDEWKEFIGTETIVFNPAEEIDYESIDPKYYGTICEFRYNTLPGQKVGKFVLVKSRPDKIGPNLVQTVMSNWNLIKNPFDKETLTGDGIQLAYTYHRWIKELLYSRIKPTSKQVLLDIGSGEGGDIQLWDGYSVVIAVEPNLEHITNPTKGLKARALRFGWTVIDTSEKKYKRSLDGSKTVVIINALAQDSNKITSIVNDILGLKTWPVHNVSIMDSGTFFGESESIMRGVATTIDGLLAPGGSIIWKMMDGDSVRSALRQKSGVQVGDVSVGDRLDISDFHLEVLDGRKVRVQLPGIVGDQEEYLTNISDLIDMLKQKTDSYSMIDSWKADNTGTASFLLGNDAQAYSRLYRYGIIKKGSSTRVEKKKKVVVKQPSISSSSTSSSTSSEEEEVPKRRVVISAPITNARVNANARKGKATVRRK